MNKRDLTNLGERVSAARDATEARGETFYPGPSRVHLAMYPPKERWDNWVELDPKSFPKRVERKYMLVPTTCFNCESACGLLAYIDKDTLEVRKFEGNPEHPGSRGRNCAKGPATINQITDPDRILHPLKRAGGRGEGRWEQVTWDEALDDIAGRIRRAIEEERHDEIMYHVGRPGEDGFTERVLASWGVDGHNSHTNVCSSGARAGYHYWMGIDRPSPDHANAKVIYLISSHLESGHYFNPHAQRVMEAKQNGAKLIVADTRLSNTATHADYWFSPHPGSEAAINLAIAHHLIENDHYDREFVRRWWNWHEYMYEIHPEREASFEEFEVILKELYAGYTFEFAATESGVDAGVLREIAATIATAGKHLSTHNWRSAAAGNLGGWQVSRTLFLLNALLGAVSTPGGVHPNAWNKYVPRPIHTPAHPRHWNEMTWPLEFPLALNEMSFLLPHFLKEGRGKLDVYFTRVYNPVWTNPDGFSWVEALTDHDKVGLHVALTPTWSETAFFADYVLPMGHGSERHDVHSYEQYDGMWIGFRQPVMRAARERDGVRVNDTREVNPGGVWEENEFWMELSWRIDPDGKMGIRKYYESVERPGERLSVDEYYSFMFENSVPGLPERAANEGMTPLEFMRRYGAFEIAKGVGQVFEQGVPREELRGSHEGAHGRVFTSDPAPIGSNIVPVGTPEGDSEGRRPVGVNVDGKVLKGFPTPSGRLEFFSTTLARWGWAEAALPNYLRSHVHPSVMDDDQLVLISTFRLPVQIHTRGGNSKWLDEIAHTNPLWIHPSDARRLGLVATDLVRVETEIGHFVLKPWITEGIRPGVVACSHHMGRWKLGDQGQRQIMPTVSLDRSSERWSMSRTEDVKPYDSPDSDSKRLWWSDVGVHQNLTFPVQPDPISGQHCWHQAVRVTKAQPGDAYGDISVDVEAAHETFKRWLEITRSARQHSPDGTRRPYWLMRPLKPAKDVFLLNEEPKHGV
ncbi:MAG: molybdopterin-dependent oxidoreductase [Actinobacteria bacterium]|nr:molybdopterin-dependent oxidoreductase [Actinomycetota bacterium]